MKGFQVSGFVPFNENVFSDDEFMATNITDRPMPDNLDDVSNLSVNTRPTTDESQTLRDEDCHLEDLVVNRPTLKVYLRHLEL